MKKYIRYALILAIACFCFITIDEVNAEVATMSPPGARLTFNYTTNYGTGLNAYQIETTAPEFAYVKSFTLGYYEYNNNYYLGSSTNRCWRSSFKVKAPEDYRPIENYTRLSDWHHSAEFANIRYVRVYERSGYFIYEFYMQLRDITVEFMLPRETFTYTGNINPYMTDLDYSSNASWTSTEFIACSLIDDVKTSSEFDAVNSKIDGMESSINSNIDDLKQKQEEAHETSKGIWASLKDGIASIGTWFSDLASSIGNFFAELGESIANGFTALFESINKLFVGEEVCEDEIVSEGSTSPPNIFTGYDRVMNGFTPVQPNSSGWMTISKSNLYNNATLFAGGKSWNDLGCSQKNFFIEIKSFEFTGTSYTFKPFREGNSTGLTFTVQYGSDNLSFNNSTNPIKPGVYNLKIKPISSSCPSNYNYPTFFWSRFDLSEDADFTMTYRIYITDDLNMTTSTYEYNSHDGSMSEPVYDTVCKNKGGLFGMLSDFFKSIGDFFAKLFGFMEDDNVDTSASGGFFDDFEDDDYGLSDIIVMPLETIKGITSSTCTPLKFPLPFVNQEVELPCMNTIYSQFGPILSIYQTITFGMIAYWVCINIYAMVRNFKNPDSDEIEVMNL